jgi:GrpB-like predicted nucleotidyltransferase (UPF0157 family)
MIEIKPFGEGMENAIYAPYDSKLPMIFGEIKKAILKKNSAVSVEHVGSTSIPGMGGRNVLDIAVLCQLQIQSTIIEWLKQIGFKESPFKHYLPLLVASTVWKEKKYFILVYVLSPDNQIYKDWIIFRNYMRQHPQEIEAYIELKKHIVAEGKTRDSEYQKAKNAFLHNLLAKIKS